MPTFVTLDTIQDVMLERKCITWKVFDEEENLLHFYQPAESTLPRDSFNTLEKFLKNITGTNFIIIRVYAPEFKHGRGGDTANTVFRYFYSLRGTGAHTVQTVNAPVAQDGNYLALLEKMNQMQMDFLKQQHERDLKELRAQVKESNKDESDYFTKVAKAIGKEMAKEWLKAEGYEVDADGTPTGKVIADKPAPTKTTTTTETAPAPKSEEIKTVFKRTGDATVRIMKVAKGLGSDYEAVAESFEDIAKLAETNPLKLKQIFDSLKE